VREGKAPNCPGIDFDFDFDYLDPDPDPIRTMFRLMATIA
jgi:hypothetical protein